MRLRSTIVPISLSKCGEGCEGSAGGEPSGEAGSQTSAVSSDGCLEQQCLLSFDERWVPAYPKDPGGALHRLMLRLHPRPVLCQARGSSLPSVQFKPSRMIQCVSRPGITVLKTLSLNLWQSCFNGETLVVVSCPSMNLTVEGYFVFMLCYSNGEMLLYNRKASLRASPPPQFLFPFPFLLRLKIHACGYKLGPIIAT